VGVHKWFGSFHALDDINLEVRPGERIVICGPSGSGKSTMIRCVNGLEDHQEGLITVDGVELTRDPKRIDAVRRNTGMVFQQFNLFPHLTVLQNCTLAPMWTKKMPRRDAEKIAMGYLELVKIPEQANKYPGHLSGGQQQRVAIARSLCMNPKLMLFDEPTSALDPEMVKEVLISSTTRDTSVAGFSCNSCCGDQCGGTPLSTLFDHAAREMLGRTTAGLLVSFIASSLSVPGQLQSWRSGRLNISDGTIAAIGLGDQPQVSATSPYGHPL
jgi:ABC-type polar amino acid transport system ATPase subunit